MTDFNATLLRERFVIEEKDDGGGDPTPLTAVSNRLEIPLDHRWDHAPGDSLIIRSKTMHSAAYFGAQIIQDYRRNGPLLNRQTPFKWHESYIEGIKGFDRTWHPGENWCAVYHNGQAIYKYAEDLQHPFLDIIEKCDAKNKGAYENSVAIAKSAFGDAGKTVAIDHETNVALVIHIGPEDGKCGVIIRGPEKKTTFNMALTRLPGKDIRPEQSLNVSGAYLEGFQLAFYIGFTQEKLKRKMITPSSPEAKQNNAAKRRLERLKDAIDQYEKMLGISYRPEKPNFPRVIYDTERYAARILQKHIAQEKEDKAEE